MIRIFGGRIIDPESDTDELGELLLDGTVIRDRGAPGAFRDVASGLDATGCWVCPGLIDLHVHLREPGFEWKETIATGVHAATAGGYTTILSMPNTSPTNDREEVTSYILRKAREANLCRVLPIGSITIGLKGERLSPMSELRDAGCVAFSDDGEPVHNAGIMRRALEWSRMLDATVCCHEEDKSLSCGGSMNESSLSFRMGLIGWPGVAEEVMIARDIELARATKARVHFCHVSTARGAELVRRAKHDGILVTAEVTPHHLLLTEESVIGYSTAAKMSPPLRTSADNQALVAALNDGTIDAIASDHAPHERDTKEIEFALASNGILGLQTNLPLALRLVKDGLLSRLGAVRALSTGPAKVVRCAGGTLRKGSPADIVVVDPAVQWSYSRETNLSKSQNSPFLGQTFEGRARDVFQEGKLVLQDGTLVKEQL